ncbi:MAG: type II toxin-antitoxin system PemK/MazF family toxin [Planctomycetes bacterium]|nr:type II toxin-antitoxin system PemK/MazF family toxin [Planctomycetota bacterium]
MTPRRGQLFWLKADHVGKPRIIVIVSNNTLNGGHCVLAVPFYSQQLEKRSAQAWCVLFARHEGGLEKDCVAKCDEISLVDKIDIDFSRGLVGTFDEGQMQRVINAIKWSIDAN